MGYMSKLNDYALEGYLQGEYGESARREAQHELWQRGRRAAEPPSEQEMVAQLRGLGYVVFKPRRTNANPD